MAPKLVRYGILATMGTFGTLFFLMHWIYRTKFDPSLGLAGPVVHRLDFVLLTVATLTEPDALPWFPRQARPSAGE